MPTWICPGAAHDDFRITVALDTEASLYEEQTGDEPPLQMLESCWSRRHIEAGLATRPRLVISPGVSRWNCRTETRTKTPREEYLRQVAYTLEAFGLNSRTWTDPRAEDIPF